MKKTTIKVPQFILDLWKEYEGDLPGEVIAIRKTDTYVALLFKSKDGELFGIDFNLFANGWDVSNDYIGPFDSIHQFKTEKLIQTLF